MSGDYLLTIASRNSAAGAPVSLLTISPKSLLSKFSSPSLTDLRPSGSIEVYGQAANQPLPLTEFPSRYAGVQGYTQLQAFGLPLRADVNWISGPEARHSSNPLPMTMTTSTTQPSPPQQNWRYPLARSWQAADYRYGFQGQASH